MDLRGRALLRYAIEEHRSVGDRSAEAQACNDLQRRRLAFQGTAKATHRRAQNGYGIA